MKTNSGKNKYDTSNNEHMNHAGHNMHEGHEQMNHENHMDHNKTDHSQMDHSKMDHSKMDHSQMGHSKMDHSQMDHDSMGGHHQHHGDFKQIFLRSLPIGLIIMWISPLMGLEIPFPFQYTFPYSDIVAAVLSTILIIYGGKPFFQGAINEFKQKAPGMMALVSMGIGVSFLYSVYAVIMRYTTNVHYMDFFFEFASLVLIMLLGHWIEMVALGNAGDAQESLAKLLPKQAQVVLADESIEERPVTELKVGDIVRVQAGENVPADGIIIRGNSRVNESLLTGESKPIEKNEGDVVIGGSTNGAGTLFVEVRETGDASFLSQVQKLVADAQNQPSRAEDKAQKVAGWLFYIATSVALIAFIVWWIIADLQTAISFSVTTLVIACPHALGLAIPLVISRSTSLGASRGLLVKNREAYELTTKADTMILDKTGTLTTGEFKVLSIDSLKNEYNEKELVALLAGIEGGSSHPIAQSIINYSEEKNVAPINFDSIEVVSGQGVVGMSQGVKYSLISQKAYGKPINIEILPGATISILTKDGDAIGAVSLGDELKSTSNELIKVLKSKGITPIMATGDNENAAKGVAEVLGIEYRANQSPQDKYDLVERLKNEGKTVVMVGDGVNDAPSLALADVGVAIGAGTQVAIDSADVVLTQSEPGDIESFIELSFRTNRKMNQNLAWGAGYNFIAIPIAAGLLAPIGITISPAVGAILMSLSTIIVAINAMALKLDD